MAVGISSNCIALIAYRAYFSALAMAIGSMVILGPEGGVVFTDLAVNGVIFANQLSRCGQRLGFNRFRDLRVRGLNLHFEIIANDIEMDALNQIDFVRQYDR